MRLRIWLKRGDPWVWLSAGAVSLCLLAVISLLLLIAGRGLGHFWPAPVYMLSMKATGESMPVLIGEKVREQHKGGQQWLVHVGNRDLSGQDFTWVDLSQVQEISRPENIVTVDRVSWGRFFGELLEVREAGRLLAGAEQSLEERLQVLIKAAPGARALFGVPGYGQVELQRDQMVHLFAANQQSLLTALGIYADRIWEFLSAAPREANTQGGVFPSILGTVIMVILMSVLVTPLGILAAVYMHEYARPGPLLRGIRIAVHNLAGVPAIVYGVFGLGFFVYFLGGGVDRLFFSETLPNPTFGTGGMLWASLTLALLTLPVVIVAIEEGLSQVPVGLREGSLALGATRLETLLRVVLPLASPAMMTGLILAVARAAGEVAPLMLVGVIKLAPALPVSGEFPFIHLDQKFMHLGFHLFDLGFQSPNVEASRGLVFATALLLVAVIVILNLTAVVLRHRLREKYRSQDL